MKMLVSTLEYTVAATMERQCTPCSNVPLVPARRLEARAEGRRTVWPRASSSDAQQPRDSTAQPGAPCASLRPLERGILPASPPLRSMLKAYYLRSAPHTARSNATCAFTFCSYSALLCL